MAIDGLQVFAVEDQSVQVCWRSLPSGQLTFEAAGRSTSVSGGGPGAVSLDGLPAATPLELTLTGPDLPRRRVARFTTLTPPPGRLLGRFATVSDVHIGEKAFGFLRTMHDDDPADPYPLRCLRAALAEALAWGAETLVVKGDLTDKGRAAEWEQAGRLLATLPVPVHITLGNHDVTRRSIDPGPVLSRHGLRVAAEPEAHDVAGLRLVLASTAQPRSSYGRVTPEVRAKIVALAAEAPGPVFLALHHYPLPTERTLHWPPGVPRSQALPLLQEVAEANPATFVSAGHSHRNRRHRRWPVPVTEVGSTKDYPGTWGGYAVHEGGIRQVVRRVAAPAAIAWTEHTRRAVGGLWGLWSPGTLPQRCFSHTWPT